MARKLKQVAPAAPAIKLARPVSATFTKGQAVRVKGEQGAFVFHAEWQPRPTARLAINVIDKEGAFRFFAPDRVTAATRGQTPEWIKSRGRIE